MDKRPFRAAARGPRRRSDRDDAPPRAEPRPDSLPPEIQTTTCWSFPSRNYGGLRQGSNAYRGATPAGVIWNLLRRYTRPGDLVVDPMAGSGTTLDVARDLDRRALGYDLAPTRPDIFRADARRLPLETGKADYVFMDPPYSTHLHYSDDPRCLGRLAAADPAYYDALDAVFAEIDRVLRPDRDCAVYVSDSLAKGRTFHPIGFEVFARMRTRFTPVDWIVVERRNRTLEMANHHDAADEGNFHLRGFNHLLLFHKPARADAPRPRAPGARPRTENPGPVRANRPGTESAENSGQTRPARERQRERPEAPRRSWPKGKRNG